jgi:two-component system OmpR family response regulator
MCGVWHDRANRRRPGARERKLVIHGGDMKILVVDDEHYVARSIQRLLASHHVTIESDPSVAISRAFSADVEGEPFDLVICDLNMPKVNGLEVLASIRGELDLCRLVLMSGSHDVLDSDQVADAILLKPFCSEDLHTLIAQLCPEPAG